MASVAAAGAAGASGAAFAVPAANPMSAVPLQHRLYISINDRCVQLHCEARSSLLDVLRKDQGLTGTKKAAITVSAAPAIVHATCKRVRKLPVRVEDLLD